MFKTFVAGVVLGIGGIVAALYFVPAVDQEREVSVISVAPNGGNAEAFQVNIPMDRVMRGSADTEQVLPANLSWPQDAQFANAATEVFKLRNSRNTVIGVASRFASRDPAIGEVVEWVLHLPARGTLYVTLGAATANGERRGAIVAGTREFEGLVGEISEQWQADTSIAPGAAGRIELQARFISTKLEDDIEVEDSVAMRDGAR